VSNSSAAASCTSEASDRAPGDRPPLPLQSLVATLARRRRERWSAEDRLLYQRYSWRSEGFRGDAKSQYGFGARHQARPLEHEDPGLSDRHDH
jgi:hypothetical protein